MDEEAKRAKYEEVLRSLAALLEGEDDWISAMASTASLLHESFDHFDWTGFYRAAAPDELRIGPYQGGHGCLRIPFEKGVCGRAARTHKTVVVEDVRGFEGHIACSATTRSEIVVPVLSPQARLLAVLDVDSDSEAAFDQTDRIGLEAVCGLLGESYADTQQL